MLVGQEAPAAAGKVIAVATSGGPHPAEKWADVTTAQLIDAPPDHPFRLAVREVLLRHHTAVQERERRYLQTIGAERLNAPFNTPESVEQANRAVSEILRLAAGNLVYRAHFELPHVRTHLWRIVAKDFANIMNIERQWFVHRIEQSTTIRN